MLTGNKASIKPNEGKQIFTITRRLRRNLILGSLFLSDLLAISAAFLFAYQIRFEALMYYSTFSLEQYRRLAAVMIPAWLLIFAAFQLYNYHLLFGGLEEYARAFNAVSFSVVLVM